METLATQATKETSENFFPLHDSNSNDESNIVRPESGGRIFINLGGI